MTEESISSAISESSKPFKYAHIERERRFLLLELPWAIAYDRSMLIEDRYLIGSTLRLRRVEAPGKKCVYKLGQKIRLDASPRTIAHTTLYLSEAEFGILSTLPASILVKTRHFLTIDGLVVGIDEFGGPLNGLLLAEVDLGTEEGMPISFPHMFATEVTDDERFTGGSLANTTSDELMVLLSAHQNY